MSCHAPRNTTTARFDSRVTQVHRHVPAVNNHRSDTYNSHKNHSEVPHLFSYPFPTRLA